MLAPEKPAALVYSLFLSLRSQVVAVVGSKEQLLSNQVNTHCAGYWLSNSHQAHNISLFGIPMPDRFPVNSDAGSQAGAAHGYSSKIFAIAIIAHTIIQHKVVKANWRRLSTWAQKLVKS
ncbi:hypothetical protein [Chamaesiphon sp. GL140_3_metabinner_50]|uniref:hypothetical protein n=1 Tax=Chamaesiphon sp. GL140_3_metabinner_50 TaxID=2970812 RepID=UPI0025F0EE80|nr:hypothetical protein [Chamaesiphon sp. GL140_3_metabinner_50]